MHISINGHIVPASRAKIPVSDSAFLYGEGFFETMKAEKGHVLFLTHHLKRLRKTARFFKFDGLPPDNEIEKSLHRLLKKNKLKEAYVRLNISREATPGEHLTKKRDLHWVIWASSYKGYSTKLYQAGAPITILKDLINDPVPLAQHKMTNYFTKLFGHKTAMKKKYHEGILLNRHGDLTEGTSSSLFMVKSGALYTPSLSSGLLPGTRRDIIIDCAKKLKIKVIKKRLRPKDLFQAHEAFLTNSLKGIMPIHSVDRKRIGKGNERPTTSALIEAYETQVRRDILQHSASRR
jgi:branched-subunit amino acid aminotransferase/4-amino-4-deoxychorismate lyase